MFSGTVEGKPVSYPLPTNTNDVSQNYVRAIRKKFHLTEQHGISDKDFYGG
jgi:hypothetical protein